MAAHTAAYSALAEQLTAQSLDVQAVKAALKAAAHRNALAGATPTAARASRLFPGPARPRTTREKLDDAATVHKLTGIAPSVAIHIPWDKPEDGDYAAMRQYADRAASRSARSTPMSFRMTPTSLGSLGNPARRSREMALDHLLECCEIMTKVRAKILSLWFADGTNYAGQDSLRGRKRRFEEGLKLGLPASAGRAARMLIEYKFFEPAFYSTDMPDWGTAYALLPQARPAGAGAGGSRPPRAGRQHRADRRLPAGRRAAGRLPLQQPQVRRRRPDRGQRQPLRAVPDLQRAGRGRAGPATSQRAPPRRTWPT